MAEAIEDNLASVAEITTWKHAFRVGQTFYTELINLRDRFDFAVIVLTPDDITTSRDVRLLSPRDNVVFELGLFLGSIGSERVYAILAEGSDVKVLSDYLGVSVLRYDSNRSDRNLIKALSAPCVRIKQRIRELGSRGGSPNSQARLVDGGKIGLEKIYDSYESAESAILDELRTSKGLVRLFFHIASQNIGLKGSLFDILDDIARKAEPEVRILHSALNSQLFAPDRLAAIGTNPDRVIGSLHYVDESLRQLEQITTSSLRRRSHDSPFIWRIYGFTERLYLMPYFAKKDATKTSPVLVFKKNGPSMYQTFVDWFDETWIKSAPENISLDKIITPATPAGTALFLNWNGFHIFGIPRRDVIDGAEYLRFYGVGGKRDNPMEPLDQCALREGAEETGYSVKGLTSSPTTDYFHADGTISRINLTGTAVLPRLIYEKYNHTGLGSMRKGDDYYYMIGFDGTLAQKPKPSKELGALLYVTNRHLALFNRRTDITLAELLSDGAEIQEQGDVSIERGKILVPHGTASYMVRVGGR